MDPYDWWQDRLADAFFGESAAGRPVVMYVDDDKVKCLRGLDGPDLVRALQTSLDWSDRDDIFDRILRAVSRWERGSRTEPPPSLPLLAVFVLAATRMHREGAVWSSNYYHRLAECLPMPRGTHNETLNRLRRSYEQVPVYWDILRRWMVDQHGARGLATFREGPQRQKRIGFALSQAIVRERDLPELEEFFRSSPGRSATYADPVEIVSALRRWQGLQLRRLSPPLREALRSPAPTRDEILGGLLADVAASSRRAAVQPAGGALARAAAGEGPDAVGRRELVLQPTFLDDGWGNWQAGWFAPVVDGVAADTLHCAGGSVVVQTEPGLSSYILTGDLPGVASALTSGLHATGARLRITQAPRGVLFAVENSMAGAWVAGDTIEADEPVLIVVRDDHVSAVENMLRETGADNLYPEEGPFPGWHVLRDVVFSDVNQASAGISRLEVGVTVQVSRRPRLVGGLPVGRESGDAARGSRYLVDGTPDVVLPAGFDPATPIHLDGRRLPPPETGRTIPLRSLALAEGLHRVEAGGFTRSFTLHAPQPLMPALPEPGPMPTQRAGSPDTASATADQGPTLDPRPATRPTSTTDRRFTVPHGAKVYFFLPEGRAVVVREPDPPRWWRRRGIPFRPLGYRVVAPRDAVWLGVLHDDGGRTGIHVRQLRDEPPRIGPLDATDTAAWSQFLLSDEAARPHRKAWLAYRTAVLNRQRADAATQAGGRIR